MDKFYVFVWWGDGYFVYENGVYIGKEDQVDLLGLLVDAGVAEKNGMPKDWNYDAPDRLQGDEEWRDEDDIEIEEEG